MARSKAQLKAGLLMGLESSSARAEQMARQLLLFDRLIEPAELVERIEAVTPEAVRDAGGEAASAVRRRRWPWSGPDARARRTRAWRPSAWRTCVNCVARRRELRRGQGIAMAFLRSSSCIDADAEVRGRQRLPAPSRHGRLRGLGRAAGDEPRST